MTQLLQLTAAARGIVYRNRSCIFPSLPRDQAQGAGMVACPQTRFFIYVYLFQHLSPFSSQWLAI